MKKLTVSFVAITLLLFGILYASAQEQVKPDYSWVTGKWTGPVQGGGNVTMDLNLVNGTEVRGLGQIPAGGSKLSKPIVHGTIDGKQVVLELYYPGTHAEENYQCNFNEGNLECSTKAGFKTTFKKPN